MTTGSQPPAAAGHAASKQVRVVVGLLLGAIVFCGLTGAEAWPLTGWRLFSERRHATQAGWLAVRVDSAEHEAPVDFEALGRGFTGSLHVMGRFLTMSAGERDEVCRSWLDALRARDASDVAGVRVYRTVRALDEDYKPVTVELRFIHECR